MDNFSAPMPNPASSLGDIAQKSISKPKSKAFYKKPIIILLVLVVCLLCMVIAFIPQPVNNQTIKEEPVKVPSVPFKESQQVINNFSDSIDQEYQSKPNSNLSYLLLKGQNESRLVELNSLGANNVIYNFAANAKIFRFYNPKNFIYAINAPITERSELYLVTELQKDPILIKKLDLNQYFIDAHFSLADKKFYYTYFDLNNTTYLESVDILENIEVIFKSNFLSRETVIWSIDNEFGLINLNQNKSCFSLIVKDKLLNPVSCEGLKSNDFDNFYWSNGENLNQYKTFSKGEIYKFTLGEKERKVILTKSNGEVIKDIWLYNDNIYYVLYALESAGPSLWNLKAKDIRVLNSLTTNDSSLKLNSLKENTSAIIPLKDSVFVLAKDTTGIISLFKYVDNPKVEELPISYSASYPVSFPKADLDWQKVDLGFNYSQIDVIVPVYTYKY